MLASRRPELNRPSGRVINKKSRVRRDPPLFRWETGPREGSQSSRDTLTLT